MHKKAGPFDCVPLFRFLQIKSGTAILLFRSSRLSHCLQFRTNNTGAHAVCIIARTYMHVLYKYIPMDISCCNVLEFCRICEILMSQNKALKTPFSYMSVQPTRFTGHTPWRGLIRQNSRFAPQRYGKFLT